MSIKSETAWIIYNHLANHVRDTISNIAINKLHLDIGVLRDSTEFHFLNVGLDIIPTVSEVNSAIMGLIFEDKQIKVIVANKDCFYNNYSLIYEGFTIVDLLNILETLEKYEKNKNN